MLKLPLSHLLNGIFGLFQSLCSFVVPFSFSLFCSLSLYPPLFRENMKQFREVLFSIYYLYPHLAPSSPFTSACQSLSCSCHCFFFCNCSICPPLFVFPFLLSVHSRPLSSALLPCPPPLSSPLMFIFQA